MIRLLALASVVLLTGCQHLTYVNKTRDVEVSGKRLVRKEDAGVELTLRRRGAAPAELVLIQVRDCVYAVDKTTTEREELVLNGTGRALVIGPVAVGVGVGVVVGTVLLLDRASGTSGSWSGLGEPIFWLGLGAGAVVAAAAPTYNVIAASDPVVKSEQSEEKQLHCSEERPTGTLTLPPPHAPVRVENGKFDVAALSVLERVTDARWDGLHVRVAAGDSFEAIERVIACAAVDRGSTSAADEKKCGR